MAEHIIIRAIDQVSPVMKTMATRTASFSKSVSELQSRLNLLSKTELNLKDGINQAEKALEQLRAEFLVSGFEEEVKLKVDEAEANLEKLKDQLTQVKEKTKETNQAMNGFTDALLQSDTRVGGMSGLKLAGSLIQDFGGLDTAKKTIGLVAGSLMGESAGKTFSSTVNGAIDGAMKGSVVPVIGTAIGAVVGGAIGFINGKLEEYAEIDNAFQAHVKSLYESSSQTVEDRYSSAEERYMERDKTLYELQKVDAVDRDYLESISKTFIDSSNLEGIDTFQVLANYLSEVRSEGVSYEEAVRLVEAGKVSGEEMTAAILTSQGKDAEGWESSYGLELKRQLLEDDLALAAIEAQKEVSRRGVQEDIAFFEDEHNYAVMLGRNVDVGISRGYDENLQSQLWRDSMGETIEKWDGATDMNGVMGAFMGSAMALNPAAMVGLGQTGMTGDSSNNEMWRVFRGVQTSADMKQTEAVASERYLGSDFSHYKDEVELQLIHELQNLTNEFGNFEIGFQTAQVFTKGRMAFNNTVVVDSQLDIRADKMTNHAWGLSRVPYDNFPALLHEGERVLTASEARAADRLEESVSVQVAGNQFVLREEADIGRIAKALAEQIQAARMGGVYHNV